MLSSLDGTGLIALVICWVLLAAVLIRLAAVWHRLPMRPAVHYNIEGRPDRHSSRVLLAVSMIAVVVVIGGISTWLIIDGVTKEFTLGVGFPLLISAVIAALFFQVIDHNVTGRRVRVLPLLLPIVVVPLIEVVGGR